MARTPRAHPQRTINLGERRQALEPVLVTDGNGHRFTANPFLPASTMYDMMALTEAKVDPKAAREGLRAAFAAVFGEDQAREAMGAFSTEEFLGIINEIYWVTPGEALASLTS